MVAGDPPRTLIDLHTHILPGLDDGAVDMEGALEMARVALADGIGLLAATPHSLQWPPGTNRATLEAHAEALRACLAADHLRLQIVVGAEMVLLPVLPRQMDAGAAVTLGRSRYLLLEAPHGAILPQRALDDLLSEVHARRHVPILAHPERYVDFQREPARLRPLVEGGSLVQVTAGSLLGVFGRAAQRTAERWLEENLVHVLASDAHDARQRAPQLARAEALAARLIGVPRAHALVEDTPAAILADQPVAVEPPRSPPRRRWLGL